MIALHDPAPHEYELAVAEEQCVMIAADRVGQNATSASVAVARGIAPSQLEV